MKHAIITICLILALSATHTFGRDLLVPSQYPTIQAAVDAADAAWGGDTVIIAPGTYTGQGNRDINVQKAVTIQSQDGPETCIIDCNGSQNDPHYGFFMSTGTLAGITVTRGYSNSEGGAISFYSPNGNNKAKITNCVLTNNYGMGGGAVFCRNGNLLEITNCSLINNSVIDTNNQPGGAIYCNGVPLLITNSTISGNSAMSGGGISGGSITIKNCIINDNSTNSTGNGGGIYSAFGSLTIIGSQISRNSSGTGAGIYCYNPTSFFISDCNISDNNSMPNYGRAGGGIYYSFDSSVNSQNALILNSSITDNTVNSSHGIGGGICIGTMPPNSSWQNLNFTISGCIIARNSTQTPSNKNYSFGGGIYCGVGSLSIIGSQISQNSSGFGSGIYCNGLSALFISDCNFHNNIADGFSGGQYYGGTICLGVLSNYDSHSSTYQIVNTSITDNIVKGDSCRGGGLYIEAPSSPPYQYQNTSIMLTDCYIARNRILSQSNDTINRGGGIYSKYAVISLSETQILQNSAPSGGGIYNEHSKIDMSRCQISGNSAVQGSAITCTLGQTSFENCAITTNEALNSAENCPLIQCDTGTIFKIANCTIVNNTPPVLSSTANSSSSIINSIIYWNSRDPESYWKFPPQPYYTITYSDIQGGYAGTGNIDADPCFVQGDYRLTAVSPCIDTGGVAFLTDNKDLAGKPRTTGTRLDMGAFEYQNTPPVAEAGPNQVIYAWIDGNSTVTLDGIASRDADGDKLTYLWRWTIDSNTFEANGVNPAIQLPVGTYKITLVVNDGFENSQPDDVNITVVGPVEGRLWFLPRVINWQYGWTFVSAMIKLPAGITKEQIDAGYKLLLYPGGIEAQTQNVVQWGDNDNKQTAILAIFDHSAFTDAINTDGIVDLSVVGKFTTGRYFFGHDTVRIIKPPPFSKPPRCDK